MATTKTAKQRHKDTGAKDGDGIYGLDNCTEKNSSVIVVPVPFAATSCYKMAAHEGPESVWKASKQVDWYDPFFGKFVDHGIYCYLDERNNYNCPSNEFYLRIQEYNESARRTFSVIEDDYEFDETDPEAKKLYVSMDRICNNVNQKVFDAVSKHLKANRFVATLGGDHAISYGAIKAHLHKYPNMGILQIDAHRDLRIDYEGFKWSHASVMHNVLELKKPRLKQLFQVGIREMSIEEANYISGERLRWISDRNLRMDKSSYWADSAGYASYQNVFDRHFINILPKEIYISCDIDGFDPALCPGTGTPVPGGISWHQFELLVETLVNCGHIIVGCDLVEVGGGDWDGNIGARVLLKMIGAMLHTNGKQGWIARKEGCFTI